MGLKASHSRFTALAVFSLLLIVRVSAKDDCQPYKWEAKRELTDEDETDGPRSAMLALLPPYPKSEGLQAGQVNCRRWKATDEEVNHSTCSELAQAYGGNFDDFLVLNPGMDRDCQNIKPLTYYCVIGFIEPLRALDGYCGPPHKNATCIGTETPCCNSETWTCGDTEYDCSPGVCYEGICRGDKVWSTDGTCGIQHGGRLCAGKWGDCCNMDGQCGSGEKFCARDSCLTGMCWR